MSLPLLLTLAAAALATATDTERCQEQPLGDGSPRLAVICAPRVLPSPAALASALRPALTAHLHISCSDLLLFESPLPPKYFVRVPRLLQLAVDNCKVLEVPTDAFDGLRELRTLALRTRNHDWGPGKTMELSVGSFDGLRQLQLLDLSHSNIRSAPDNVFCSLGNLQTLNMTDNSIRDVNSIGFPPRPGVADPGVTVARVECSGGTDLRSLDVSHNEIRTIPPFSGITRLRRLQNLYLQHNQIADLSPDSFSGLSSLRVLNLSSNKLESVPENIFSSAKEIREIYLNNNSLYELARGIFHRLEQLLILDLSGNQLSSNQIDDGTFVGLIRLIVLNLAHNSLTRIDARTFKDLYFLQILDLRNNSIGFIEDNAFQSLYNLHTLNIAENRLHHITSHLMNGLFGLSKLTLNNNLIVNIDPKAFKNCSDLKELDLSSNAIQDIPEAITELSFLKTLDLGENQITGFKNGSFKNLQQLTGLRLIDNQIGNISKGMFWDLTGLQVLNLAKNKIQQIERGTFERNTQLEAIRLDANFLTDINGVFTTLVSLVWLNLSENHLVWFDYAFVPSNLKWLHIRGNYIERLGNYYNIQDQLRISTLDASHNRITEINEMSIPNSAEVVFINNNFINNVSVNTFFHKTSLARVDMYANELTKLELNTLRLKAIPANRTLPEFYLGGNPFDCDCSMDWLPMINNMSSTRQYPRVMDLENVMCRMTHNRGTTRVAATVTRPSDFLCKYETHCFALCHCCDFDACDCEMTCPTNCTCYHDQTWNTNVVDCSRQSTSLIPRRIPMDATHVYLDGNDFKELQNHVFIGRKNMKVLFVNASRIESIQNRTFNGLNGLVSLHLEDNLIYELKGFEFEHLSNLKELYLQNNVISKISNTTFIHLRSLEILRLDGNRLLAYPVNQFIYNPYLVDLSLGGNPWSCQCSFLLGFQAWLLESRQKVSDIRSLWCQDDPQHRRLIELNTTVCNDYYSTSMIQSLFLSDYLPVVLVSFLAVLLVLIVAIVLYIFRDPLRLWLYSKYGVRLFKTSAAKHYGEDREKLYDGYVLYSPKDEEFVLDRLVAELEHGSPSYQLCLHYRDLPHHAPFIQQSSPVVLEAAEASKRVILVLTQNFLQTEWARAEVRSALGEAVRGRPRKLLLVEEGGVGPLAARDAEFRPLLRAGARLRWGERRFWQRLRALLPPADPARKHFARQINDYTLDSGVQRRKREPPAYSSSSTLSRTPPRPDDAHYSSATTATPSPRPRHQRPPSDHIYHSIDSPEPPPAPPDHPWRPAAPVVDAAGVQAYLV